MKVTEVSVSIHEKRAHPYEMGHYDCEVSLTAALERGEPEGSALTLLRQRARLQVQAECDAWQASVLDQRAQREHISMAKHHIEQIENGWAKSRFYTAKEALRFIGMIHDPTTAFNLKERLGEALEMDRKNGCKKSEVDVSDIEVPF